jgi:hypothetical protein
MQLPQPGTQSQPQPQGGGADPSQLNSLLQQLIQKATQRHTSLAGAAPTQQPQQRSPYNTNVGGTPAEQKQSFFYNLGATIQNAGLALKEKQIKQATGTMQTLSNAWDEAQNLANGDQQKALQIFNKMPQVQGILSDPKQVKQLGKLLQYDALNPEKNKTSMHVAAERVGKANKIKSMMGAVKQAITQNQTQRGPYDAQQQAGIAQRLVSRAPATQESGQSQLVQDVLKSQLLMEQERQKEEHADKMEQEREDFRDYQQQVTEDARTTRQQLHDNTMASLQHMRDLASDQRESAREAAMLKGIGMRDADKFQVTPAQLNTQVNGALSTLKQQLAMANASLEKMRAEADKRDASTWQRLTTSAPDLQGAQDDMKHTQAAIDYIESQRSAIIKGTVQLSDVTDNAFAIMGGAPPPDKAPTASGYVGSH